MKRISGKDITKAVKDLFIDANRYLPEDTEALLQEAKESETSPLGKSVLQSVCDNLEAAKTLQIPICQDTGMAVVFIELGREVYLEDDLEEAVNEGVRQAYAEGYMRCSVVKDPLFHRENTGDNTPAIIHIKMCRGDQIRIIAAPKGFGSENMSRLKMFTPSATEEQIISFVAECVKEAGGNPCPPLVVGVGIGGSFEYAAYLSKKAAARSVSKRNPDPAYAALEEKIRGAINATGVGPQGFGGKMTALAVNIEKFPTHIAGLPVAVNINCHAARHKETVL